MRGRVVAIRVLVAAAVLLPGATSPGGVPLPARAQSAAAGRPWSPSAAHAPLALERVRPGLLAYNPHRGAAHLLRGSGHTHAAPDHSGISTTDQERRLRDLGPAHRHDFVWMTSHDVVVPDPGVEGITHLFGVEIYADRTEAYDVHPHLLALLPDGRLASRAGPPFGVREHPPGELIELVHRAGGRAVLAHPSRYSLPLDAVADLPAELWAVEVPSGTTDPAENEAWLDARLSAGRFACVSAGGDIHDEDYALTRGYQVVAVGSVEPSREALWNAIASCDFFACAVRSDSYPLIEGPSVEIRAGAIRMSTPVAVTRIEAVGANGRVLAAAQDTDSLAYRPAGDERYVRFRARRALGGAVCFSQPVWLVPG